MGQIQGNSQTPIAPGMPRSEASFDVALAFTGLNEGGFVNNKNDQGRATNFGITQKTLSAWLGRPASVEDVRTLTKATADLIYRANYWQEIYSKLPQAIATAIFDWGVNHGPGSARRDAQRTINNLGYQMQVDGSFDLDFVEAAWRVGPARFCDEYAKTILAVYLAIIASNPSQKEFEAGWRNRAARIAALGRA